MISPGRAVEQLLGAVEPQQLDRGVVGVHLAALGVDDRDRLGEPVDDDAELLLGAVSSRVRPALSSASARRPASTSAKRRSASEWRRPGGPEPRR